MGCHSRRALGSLVAPMPSLSVVVPSYGRPDQLRRCLQGLCGSTRRPDEVLVVLRPEDSAGREVARAAGARIVDVHDGGHLPPLVAGLAALKTEVMAILDDDAVPRPEWVERLGRWFTKPRVVAVGGPVHEPARMTGTAADTARRLRALARRGRTWYRGFANLPLPSDFAGATSCDAVGCDHLSGGNLALRVDCLRSVGFDLALNRGAAIAWEADVCLGLARMGDVVFDPLLVVNHYRAPRRGAPPRGAADRYAVDYSRNLFHIAAKHFSPAELAVFLPFMLLVGQTPSPGLTRTVTGLAADPGQSLRLACAVGSARWDGWRTGWAARRSGVQESVAR